MIPRILVPKDARPSAATDVPTQRRRPTTLDERTLVPAMLPIVVLDGHSTIPTNLPLESIAARTVVRRDVNREAYSIKEDLSTPLQPTEMDERIAVPLGAAPPQVIEPPSVPPPEDLVDPTSLPPVRSTWWFPSRRKRRPSGSSSRVFLPWDFTFCCSWRSSSNRSSFLRTSRPRKKLIWRNGK